MVGSWKVPGRFMAGSWQVYGKLLGRVLVGLWRSGRLKETCPPSFVEKRNAWCGN
mgnify:CR=1 FL=1